MREYDNTDLGLPSLSRSANLPRSACHWTEMVCVELFRAEVHEYATEILRVLLDPEVLGFDLRLVQEPEHPFLQRPGSFAGDDFDQWRLLGNSLFDNRAQRAIDIAVAIVDVVQIERQLHLLIFDHRLAFLILPRIIQ